ncbi:MAG: SulP family inorganic anion transporter [Sphingomonas sp.]|uniref:SulP family inorganic anion transporter n=1 Tax=Sphingomonas sp. TaxID=28214 RepID=UPI00356852CC
MKTVPGIPPRIAMNIVAGLSVAGLMLPEAVAYAGIAGLAPGRAIVAALAGGVAYAVLGRSRFAIIGPTSSSAAILAAALATLPGSPAERGAMATMMVAMVGIMFALIAAFRLGSLSSFIARPVLRGFAFGLAINIIIRQLPHLLGLKLASTSTLVLLADIVASLGQANGASLAIGLVCLALLIGLRATTRLPAVLIVLLLGVAASRLIDLPALGVAPVGPIDLGMAPWALPDFGFARWSHLVQLAAPLTLILLAESWGTVRTLALRHGDSLSADREFGALAGANLLSALGQGMPVGAGFSAAAANESAGATSRIAAIASLIALAAAALLAGPAIEALPAPLLAAVVIAALTHSLSPAPLSRLFKVGRDQWIALAAVAGVILFGVLDGMLIAVALSIGALLYRLSHPAVSELGRLGDSHNFVDRSRHVEARAVAGVAIFRPNAPLFFANAEQSLGSIAAKAMARPGDTDVVLSLEESDDLDSTALEAIAEFEKQLNAKGLSLHLARAHDRVRDVLAAAGLDRLARGASFSVADAVRVVEEQRSAQ